MKTTCAMQAPPAAQPPLTFAMHHAPHTQIVFLVRYYIRQTDGINTTTPLVPGLEYAEVLPPDAQQPLANIDTLLQVRSPPQMSRPRHAQCVFTACTACHARQPATPACCARACLPAAGCALAGGGGVDVRSTCRLRLAVNVKLSWARPPACPAQSACSKSTPVRAILPRSPAALR